MSLIGTMFLSIMKILEKPKKIETAEKITVQVSVADIKIHNSKKNLIFSKTYKEEGINPLFLL